MAIEPISSAMTFNAQPIAQQQAAPRPVEKSAEEFTEGSMQNAAQPVDNVTLEVNSAQAKDGENGGQSQQGRAIIISGIVEQYRFFHIHICSEPAHERISVSPIILRA